VPLLWVIPLGLYLLSFILAFARLPGVVQRVMVAVLPVAILVQTFFMVSPASASMAGHMLVHFVTLFVAAMVCHGELAGDRPPVENLTEFYLWLSAGGVLGGLFNAVVAPYVFYGVAEYPIALVLTALLMPSAWRRRPGRWLRVLDVALPAALGLVAAVLLLLPWYTGWAWRYGVVLALCGVLVVRPVRFGIGLAVVWAVIAVALDRQNFWLHQERNFFGVLSVRNDWPEPFLSFFHGRICHGSQCRRGGVAERRRPLRYFFPTGPVGQVFRAAGHAPDRRVAVMGLGIGTLAAYAEKGQDFTFFEIDPAVERIARDPEYFTYLKDAADRGVPCPVVLGDARLSLGRMAGRYDLIFMDAFSGDAVPAHLLTCEAVTMYLDHLAPDGMLVVHISNGYLDLEPVVADLARSLGLAALTEADEVVSAEEERQGKTVSYWVVLARRPEHFGKLARDSRWQPPASRPGVAAWTDDYSNLVSIFRW
jgi:hypothetical protein